MQQQYIFANMENVKNYCKVLCFILVLNFVLAIDRPILYPTTKVENCTNCIVAKEGENLTVWCNTTTVKRNVEFVKGERFGSYFYGATEYEAGAYVGIIPASRINHLNTLICSEESRLQSAVHLIYLLEKPRLPLDALRLPKTIKEGYPANFTCTILGGRPPPRPVITISDKVIESETSTFSKGNVSHTIGVASVNSVPRAWNGKWLKCRYENAYFNATAGYRKLNVLYKPNITITQNSKMVTCSAPSEPLSNITLLFNVDRRLNSQKCNSIEECSVTLKENVVDGFLVCLVQYGTEEFRNFSVISRGGIRKRKQEEKISNTRSNNDQVPEQNYEGLNRGQDEQEANYGALTLDDREYAAVNYDAMNTGSATTTFTSRS
ncbi:uncharacterized protein LOC128234808 isoform X2 [Mya arenaria]|uniref:uncharacterized protein LOC128234808 isoform X2 n=1 Tax=Mya arenaria TaxID=6604 RepID=UPI0022E2C25A|nr:uncharacterized protein LOC128234808 isoform X2 [Mya arenaria]